ncbi:MAG: tetratricopeptide repeat protein [Chloroflexota bacterium]
MDEIVSFGEWVQARRNQLRFSRTALAREVGCSPVTIKKIERDERRASSQMAQLLATHLQIPAAKQANFIRRARGEFVSRFESPTEMALIKTQATIIDEQPVKHNLLPQATPFIGRQTELAQIGAHLANPDCRLLTILGAGGMGKTRLSIEAAMAQVSNFTDGVVYVELAPITAVSVAQSTNPIATALVDGLGISIHGGEAPEQQIIAYLQRREMLLLLDNFEHLLDAADFLHDLLTHAPDIKIVTTSRERLNLQQEWLFPLAGLHFPKVTEEQADSSHHSAVTLFAQRAKQGKPSFDVEQELLATLHICQLVDGMPLALELAATWVRQLSCAQIAAEIKTEIDFLATHSRNMPARHRSVRALFDYSWQQMTAAEQNVFKRLSVFRGGFERNAAKAVANASLQRLQALVNKSLLSVSENGRYHIHELLRQFAAEKLAQAATEESDAHNRHSQHFLSLVASTEPALKGHDILIALQTIEQDIENIRSAVRWTAAHQLDRFDKQFGVSLEIFYFVKGWFLESQTTFKLLADKLQALCQAVIPSKPPEIVSEIHLLWIQYRTNLGIAQTHLGHIDVAKQTHQQSLSLLPKGTVEAQWARAWCLLNLGYSSQYDIVVALNYFQESARLAQQAGDHWLQAVNLVFVGNGLRVMGDYREAKPALDQSLAILQQQGERVFSSFAMSNLARLAKDRGDLITAEAHHLECLAERQKLGMKMGIAYAFWDLGRIMLWQDKYQDAYDYFQQGIAFSKEANLPTATGASLWGLGNVALTLGDFLQAERYFQESQQIHHSGRHSRITGGLGWVAIGLGHYSKAEQHFITDLRHTRMSRWVAKGFDSFVGLACIAAQNGQFDQSLELLALVRHHPASTYENKKKANALWQELTAELPHETAVKAESRGKKRDFLDTIDQFLNNSPLQSSYAPHKNKNRDD